MNPTKGSITSCLLLYILLDIALTAALTVPKFVQHPESQVIKQNSKAVLHCMVLPETAQIQWTFNGKPLESHDGVEVRRRQLTIQSFRHAWKGSEQSHEGVYQCKAITSVGVILSNEAILERAFLGQFPQGEDQTVSATEGNTALIPCDPPQGSPRPLISFERNGVTMDTSSHRHHVLPSGDLQIAEVRQSDEGEYRCVGENPVSGQRRVSSHTVTLHVRSPTTNSVPRFVEKMERMQTVVQGEDLVLECVVQGSPVPVVMWDKHSGQMPQGRVSLLLGNLVIRDVQVADQGTYICRAENTVGVPATDYVDVDVLEPPSVGIPPADQVAIEGATVVFQCLARGRNVYTQWLYNGQQVDSHTQFSISDTSLTITRVTKENTGIYQCVARSRLGMTSSAALLQVKGQDEVNFTWPEVPDSNKEENNPSNNIPLTAPFITVSPSNTTVERGRTLILPCQATDTPTTLPPTASGKTTEESSTLSSTLSQLSPLLTQPSEQTAVTVDQYSGEPAANNKTSQPISITWFHNGSLITGLFLGDGVWISRSAEEVERLEILHGQEGLHLFNNYNKYSYNNSYKQELNKTERDSVNTSDEQKTLRVGSLIPSGGLKIVEVTASDSGIYTCVAANSVGLSYVTASLHVLEPTSKTTASPDMGKSTTDPFPSLRPGDRRHRDKSGRKNGNNPRNGRRPSESNSDNLVPPTTPEIAKLSDTSVHVRWSVPQNDGLEITFFKIQFKDVSARNKEDRKWDTYSMDIPGTTNEYEVRRLKPGATYKFRVLAVYSNMDNRWSQPSRRVTLVDGDVPRFPPTPSSGPIIVKAEPVGPNTISLKWQYNEDDSGEIEGYNIYYKPFNSNGPYSRQEILGGNTVRYVLTGLHPDTYYTIRMKSYNQQGEGPDSNEVVKATNEVTGYTRVSPHNTWPQNNDEWTTSTRRVPSEDFGSSSTGRSNQTLYMVLGIALGLALVILLIIMLLCWRKQKRDRQAQNSQKTDSMRKKEQQMNGGPHHFLLHNMNANSPNGINGSIRNGRFGGSQGGQTNGTNHMSLTVNPYTGTTQAHAGDQNTHQDASERNYSPEDLEIQNLRRSLQELLQQPPAPPLPHQDRNGIPVYYSNTASTVNINTRGQPNYYEVDPAHHDTLPRVHMATFGCPDCSTSRSRPQSRAESSLSNTAPPEYNSLGLRAQPMFSNTRSSTEIPDYSGSLHRQKPITNPYHIYNKDSSNPYRNSPDHIPRSHERPPFRPHDVYSRSLRGPAHELAYNYPPGYDTAVAKYGSVDNNPDIYEQVSDNHSVGSSSGRLRSRRKSPHRGSASNTRNMGFVPVGGQQRMEQHPLQPDRSVNLGHDLYPTSQALPAMHLPQPIKRGDTSTVPPQLPPRNLLQNNSYSTSPFMETENYSSEQQSQNQLDPVHTDPVQSENVDSENRRESPQVIDDLSQDLPVLSGSLEASYGTGETDTAPPSIGHRDLNATTSDNLDSDLEMSDNEGNEEGLHSAESVGLQEELSPLVRPVINTVKTGSGVGSTETTPLMQRNIPRANDYPSDDDNEDC